MIRPTRISARLHETMSRLAAAEEQALAGEFLAPAVRGGVVHVRIGGLVCRFKVGAANSEGWGVFRATSATTAELVRRASLVERRRYLEGLPRFRAILCRKEPRHWLSLPAHGGDGCLDGRRLVITRLVEACGLFETVVARFDGAQCWLDGPDERCDPAAAAYLRSALERMVEPDRLHRSGLTPEQRTAYLLNYLPRLEADNEAQRDRVESRIRKALAHGGARLEDYQDRGEAYRVAFEVDGRRHVSVVAARDLSVQVAGICLNGEDRRFDLQSLVGVLREADEGGDRVNVGADNQGIPEEIYWTAHPPR